MEFNVTDHSLIIKGEKKKEEKVEEELLPIGTLFGVFPQKPRTAQRRSSREG